MSTVYLNGEFLPKEGAQVSVEDRGFLLSDGVYEVTPAYGGEFFLLRQHFSRLRSGLDSLRIDYDPEELVEVHRKLIDKNGLTESEVAIVYLQITRGVAERTHYFPPAGTAPTVYAFAKKFQRPSMECWLEGFEAVTVPDRRWSRADIKSISLLPNVLAAQAAVDAGVDDALLVKNGIALEGAQNNLFAVKGGVLVTHPATQEILHGITRSVMIEIAHSLGISVQERPIQVEELETIDELFFSGTTTEVRPTVRLDSKPVGSGEVGPVSKAIYRAFRKEIGQPIDQDL
ncbi:MAG TPA: D-amino acid aminotransferase [Gemmatimonadetes bacterium]|jgi:D-alanine transaminase|nr:D-amino acid aminotransferase [Gemmatimonadota bacterium]